MNPMANSRPSATASIMVQNPAAHLLSGSKSKSGAKYEDIASELPNSTEKVPFAHNGQLSHNQNSLEVEAEANQNAHHYNGDACMIYLPKYKNQVNFQQQEIQEEQILTPSEKQFKA